MKINILLFYFLLILLTSSCSNQENYLPGDFFELHLDNKLHGAEALEYVNNLHLQDVAADSNKIGFYNGYKGNAIIYISYYQSEESAKTEEKKMTEKISPENSVFVMGEYQEIEGKNIYRTYGMGQTHYVFSFGKELIWISLGTLWAEDFLKEYLHYIEQ